MMRTLVAWQAARWLRSHPGRAGLVALGCMPLLYLIPLQRIGLVDDWRVGAWSIAFILPLPLTAILMRDSASVPPAAVWLFQKGVRLEDVLVLRWTIDLVLVTLLSLWSGIGILIGGAMYDTAQLGWALHAVLRGILAAFPAAVLLFGLAAAGSQRGGDLLVLLAFISLLEPVLALFLGPAARTGLHAVVLPMIESAALPRSLRNDLASALHTALHIALWTSAWLAFGCWRLRQWRPGLGPRD